MSHEVTYRIERIDFIHATQVIAFLKRMRLELFPAAVHQPLPTDLDAFNSCYVNRPDAAMYAALTNDDKVIGTIGFLKYDERFPFLSKKLRQTNTTEIVRCYIDTNYRRLGIGTKLFTTINEAIAKAGYENIYLHTHPFLPGGAAFWQAQGFTEDFVEKDSPWQTIHLYYPFPLNDVSSI